MNETAIAKAVAKLKGYEGCKLHAYLDIVGVPTIGYGETRGVKMGDVWTQEQADSALTTRAREFMDAVLRACPGLADGPDYRLAACTTLAYNIGTTGFAGSTVARLVNAKNYLGAADAFMMWTKAGGKVSQGLINRRTAEKAVFLGG